MEEQILPHLVDGRRGGTKYWKKRVPEGESFGLGRPPGQRIRAGKGAHKKGTKTNLKNLQEDKLEETCWKQKGKISGRGAIKKQESEGSGEPASNLTTQLRRANHGGILWKKVECAKEL